jgi:hypothetical protein
MHSEDFPVPAPAGKRNVDVEDESHDSACLVVLTEEQHDTDPLFGLTYSPSGPSNLKSQADLSNRVLDIN